MVNEISGWWFGTWLLFFHSVGNVIIPTDELHHFSEGLKIPPTSYPILNNMIMNQWILGYPIFKP